MELKKKENIGWIDLLRVLACFFVVFSHSCDAFIGQFDANRESFLTGVFLGSLMRPCVPIFVMMTGVLLLPVQTDMAAFYKKRIGRLIPPMIFWSLVLPVLYFIYLNYINPDTQNPLISMPDHSLEALWFKLYTFIFNFNFEDKEGKRVRKQLEVDFVVNQGNQRYYIQVAYDMISEEKQTQEFNSLRNIPDSFKKIVIVNGSKKPWRNDEGFVIMGMKYFLLNANSLEF